MRTAVFHFPGPEGHGMVRGGVVYCAALYAALGDLRFARLGMAGMTW